MASYSCITVYQPWASLIAIGAKPMEFRGYPPPASKIGHRIAIHAAARPVVKSEVVQLYTDVLTKGGGKTGLVPDLALPLLQKVMERFEKSGPTILPTSAVVCLATLGRGMPQEQVAGQIGAAHVNDSTRRKHSAWGWPLTDVEQVTGHYPYVRGLQGWFTWEDHRRPVVAVSPCTRVTSGETA